MNAQAAELDQANEVKSEFLSVISHELRTPINVMMGYVELVQQGLLGEIKPQQNDALKTEAIKNLESDVGSLLKCLKIEVNLNFCALSFG